jgi:hypothetical protein
MSVLLAQRGRATLTDTYIISTTYTCPCGHVDNLPDTDAFMWRCPVCGEELMLVDDLLDYCDDDTVQ